MAGLYQDRVFALGVNLDSSPSVVQYANLALGVDLDRTWVAKVCLEIGVVSVGQSPLPDHVRVGLKLLFTPLRQASIASHFGGSLFVFFIND